MKLLKSRKIEVRNLAKFLVAVTVLTSGIFGIQYFANALSITNITPNTGSVVGGQEVTITGDFTFTPTTLQQITQDYCTNEMSTYPTNDSKPDTITLADIRNNQDYRIRKLADGKCWMIDNLKLELTDGMVLTPADTNVKANTTVTLATGGLTGNFTTENYLTVDNQNNTGTDYDNYNAWRQADPDTAANCLNNYSANNVFNGNVAYNDDSLTGCGYLYNFYTATAGTGDNTKTSGEASSSICPAGWRLPVGTTSGDFAYLDKAYGGIGDYHGSDPAKDIIDQNLWLSAGAWQGTLSSYYNAGKVVSAGSIALYWSSSIISETNAYFLSFNAYSVRPGVLSGSRFFGPAVRCVMDEGYAGVMPTVTFGGAMATVVSYSDTEIVVKTPEHLAGKVDVVVTRGSESFTLSNAYEYFNVPDVPNTGIAKTSATTTAVQSGLTALIIITIGTVTFVIKHRKARQH